jgi:curved DNA-binding protein CbpA
LGGVQPGETALASASFDPYSTLQVTPDADEKVIAAAYRALARRHHPDVAGEHGTARMARLNRAWELIGTPEAREAHDRERRGRRYAAGAAAPGTNGNGVNGATRTAADSWYAPAPDGTGAAGPPPGRPFGSVLPFGRHIGWSLGEIARADPGYLEWLEERPQGRPYLEEIDAILRRVGRRDAPVTPVGGRMSRFGRG